MAYELYNRGELLKQARRAVERGNLNEAESMIKAIHARQGTTPIVGSAIKTAPAQRTAPQFGRRRLVQTACGSYRIIDLDAPGRWGI